MRGLWAFQQKEAMNAMVTQARGPALGNPASGAPRMTHNPPPPTMAERFHTTSDCNRRRRRVMPLIDNMNVKKCFYFSMQQRLKFLFLFIDGL
jgi:hypothetical protein